MDRSPGFGSTHTDLSRPIKTWFPFGSVSLILNLACTCNSPDRSTKSTRFTFRCSTVCKHRVSGSFSLPSRGSFHLSFTVLYAIGHWQVFSLGGWSPLLPTRFLVSRGTPDTAGFNIFSLTRLSRSLARFSKTVQVIYLTRVAVLYPAVHAPRFGLLRFRSPLLSQSLLFSFPPAT